MSFLDDLRNSRETSVSALHIFLLNISKTEDSVHAFFEGNDDLSFYSGFINLITNNQRKVFGYKCGNKKTVYETYEKIKEHSFNDKCVLFFVDKDLSDLLGEKYPSDKIIFVTDCCTFARTIRKERITGLSP